MRTVGPQRRAVGRGLLVVAWALVAGADGVGARQAAQQPAPTFRSRVDVVELDVTVLDKDRHPVRDLTASDFTVTENGKPRPIVAFTAVEVPPSPAVAATWTREIAPDVSTNETAKEGRIAVIVMDRSIPQGPPAATARQAASAVIDQLGPADLGAVIYTNGGQPQDFTSDHERLRRAIGYLTPGSEVSDDAQAVETDLVNAAASEAGMTPIPLPTESGACYCGLCVMDAIRQVAQSLQNIERRRKSLFFIGSEIRLQDSDMDCAFRIKDARTTMLEALDRANVTVYSVDPGGLQTSAQTRVSVPTSRQAGGRGGLVVPADPTPTANALGAQNSLGVLPDHTGGRTVINSNDPAASVAGIFHESDAYYLLGIEATTSASADDFHKVSIKVNRRGLTVHARQGYYSPIDPEAAAASTKPSPPSLTAAVLGTLPRTDLPMTVTIAPFGVPGKRDAAVALVIGLRQPRGDGTSAAPAEGPRPGASVTLLASVFDREGRPKGVMRQQLTVGVRGEGADAPYESISRLNLPPGSYEVRIAAESSDPRLTGSVFTYVDVPSFASEPVSLSGMLLEELPPLPVAMSPDLGDLLPVRPTVRRSFKQSSTPTAFVRIYQGGNALPVDVQVVATVLDAQNGAIATSLDTITGARFSANRSADFGISLPLAAFKPGEYLLRVAVALGNAGARRDLRFTVLP